MEKKLLLLTLVCMSILVFGQQPVINNKAPNTPQKIPTKIVSFNEIKRAIAISTKSVTGKGEVKFNKGAPTNGQYKVDKSNKSEMSSDDKICITEDVSIKGGNSEFALLSPAATIMPGMVFDINSIIDGSFKELTLPRASLDLQVSVLAGNTSQSKQTITGPLNAALMYDKAKQVVRAIGHVQLPFNESLQVEEMDNVEQLEIKAGASYSGFGQKVKADFAYLNESERHKFGVYYVNKVFELFIAAPNGGYRGILTPDASYPANACVVNSVSFGKVIAITVETDLSKEDINLVLGYEGDIMGGHVEADFDLRKKSLLNNTTIKAFTYGTTNSITSVVGGSGIEAIQKVKNYLKDEGKRWDVQNNAVQPIAYQLRFLDDGSVASINSTLSYKRRTCVKAISSFNIKLLGFLYTSKTGDFEGAGVNLFGDLRLSGSNTNNSIWSITDKGPYAYGTILSCGKKAQGNIFDWGCTEAAGNAKSCSNANYPTQVITIKNNISDPPNDIKFTVSGRLRRQMGMGGWDYQPYTATFTLKDILASQAAPERNSRLVLYGLNVHNEVIAHPIFEVTLNN